MSVKSRKRRSQVRAGERRRGAAVETEPMGKKSGAKRRTRQGEKMGKVAGSRGIGECEVGKPGHIGVTDSAWDGTTVFDEVVAGYIVRRERGARHRRSFPK